MDSCVASALSRILSVHCGHKEVNLNVSIKLSSGGWAKVAKFAARIKAGRARSPKKPDGFAGGVSDVEKLLQSNGNGAELPLELSNFSLRINR